MSLTHLVIGAAFLVLFVAVPIATAALFAGDGALHRWAAAGLRVWAARGRGPSSAHPAARAVEACRCESCVTPLPASEDEWAHWLAMEQKFPAPRKGEW